MIIFNDLKREEDWIPPIPTCLSFFLSEDAARRIAGRRMRIYIKEGEDTPLYVLLY
ncbi:MAG: hypothetical protein V1770_00020 [bacterium]